jgi:DNA repair photolyase
MAKLAQSEPVLPFFLDRLPGGMAGLAATSSKVRDGHEVEYRNMVARSILNRAESQRGLPFQWSINPYRGCEFACRYCYARYTHEFMELRDPADFEQKIFIKDDAARLLRHDLHRVAPGEVIAIGTATDPYQPIERTECVTRSLLEVFAQCSGYRIGIVTKSVLILRDIELLQKVAERNDLTLHVTITTDDVELARKLEPRAPRPDLRFRAVRRLREAGLRVGVLCCPAMPGINDSQPQLDRMAYLAAAAKASFFTSGALFLKPSSKGVFEAFVSENFPHLLKDLRRRFANGAFQSKEYHELLATRVASACKRHGLSSRRESELFPEAEIPGPQLVVQPKPQASQQQFFFAGLIPVAAVKPALPLAKGA